MLLAVELLQAFRYFVAYGRDPLWTRILVEVVLVVDTLSTVASCSMVFLVSPLPPLVGALLTR